MVNALESCSSCFKQDPRNLDKPRLKAAGDGGGGGRGAFAFKKGPEYSNYLQQSLMLSNVPTF